MVDARALRAFEPRIGHAPEANRPRGEEIVSIVAAHGWRARYRSGREQWTEPVAAWALVRRFGLTVVVGLLAVGGDAPGGDLVSVHEWGASDFDGYESDDGRDDE